jgi:hypothetical protein
MKLVGRLALFAAVMLATLGNPGIAAGEMISGVMNGALQRQAKVRGEAEPERALRLPAGGALAAVEPFLQAVVSSDQTAQIVAQPRAVQARNGPTPAESMENGNNAALHYPISSTVSFGLGYRYMTSEDVALEVTESGALAPDYNNHSVLVRAHWRF